MPKKLTQEIYAIIVPKRTQYGPPDPTTGQKPCVSFRIDRIVKSRPTTKNNEVAVKLRLTVDSSIFDKLIPAVEIELGERELFVNTRVEINGEAVEDEDRTFDLQDPDEREI